MRVVLDARYPPDRFPGIGRYVQGLAGALAELPGGPEVAVVCDPAANPPAPPRGGRLETTAGARSLAEQWRLPALVRRAECDLWHAPYVVYPYAVPMPVVATVFDVIGTRPTSGADHRAVALAVGLALRRARLVITASEAACRQIARAFPASAAKLRVVPSGVASQFTPPPAESRRQVPDRLGLPARYLLYVGTDRPHKNLPRLVEGFGRYRRSAADDIVLVLAGLRDPRFSPAPARAVADHGLGEAVRFLGRVADDDLPALYAGAELFVSPSLEEGFGFPVLEAMACGAAVACSTAPALVELAGDAAVLFPPDDAGSMAAAIAEGLDRQVELRRRGSTRARLFSLARCAAGTAEVYREALDRPPSPWRYQP